MKKPTGHMSEIDQKPVKPKDHPSIDPDGRNPVSAATVQTWYEKVYNPPANDLKGHKCSIQPRPDEIAYLQSGKSTKGCDYRTFANSDIPALFREEKGKSVYIEETERERHHKKDSAFSGSGVIVGKRHKNELLILTDNHVVGGDRGSKLKDVYVRTPDGVAHEGRVVDRTPKEDLALVAIKVDPKQMSKFEVAKAVKSLSFVHPGDKALGLGYPMDAEYLYASPGSVKITAPVHALTPCDSKTCYGEDWNRPMIEARLHSKTGNSGGGVWNHKRELFGLVEGGNDSSIKYTLINPVTQHKIDNMIRRAKAWDQS
ncbi:MAG: serine protease [Candidatus Obscuribacterales bacterium]|nr:serine protease [Candidatus Obscuribacterales bacterium]